MTLKAFQAFQKIRIFVASPEDVQSERNQLAKVVEELNITIPAIAPEKNVFLELVRWETHVHPELGKHAQAVVNPQIGDYDIFIGILWKRMGTPTPTARSGTEEEFNNAYKAWRKKKTLAVLFYFCQQPFPPPRSKEEVTQIAKVVDFRIELSNKGLVSEYRDHGEFADVVRRHLLLLLGKALSQTKPEPQEALSPEPTTKAESLAVWQHAKAYAQEYENIRATMDSGPPRTRMMEAVFSKMRTLALAGHSLLPELVASSSPGHRLMALAILLSMPNPDYIAWLAQRFQLETPFVGYHAGEALLAAVRTLHETHAKQLQEAIDIGKKTLKENIGIGAKDTDRYLVLEEADRELKPLTAKRRQGVSHPPRSRRA